MAEVGEHLERAVAISSFVSGGAFLSCRSLGGGRMVPSEGRSGSTGLRSSVGVSQPLGGRESGEGLAIGKLLGRPQGLGGSV